MTQEKVHWGVELDIQLDLNNHPHIPQKGNYIEIQKHQKEENLQPGVVSKAHENELGYCGEIILGHGFNAHFG